MNPSGMAKKRRGLDPFKIQPFRKFGEFTHSPIIEKTSALYADQALLFLGFYFRVPFPPFLGAFFPRCMSDSPRGVESERRDRIRNIDFFPLHSSPQ